MAAPSQQSPGNAASQPVARIQQQQRQSPGNMDAVLDTTLKIGAGAGACGLLVGGVGGIVRGAPPILFSLVNGAMWFSSASIFYGTRHFAISRHGPISRVTPSQKVEASAIGGACSGALVAAIFRGRSNVLPAAAVASLLGTAGQAWLNRRDARRAPPEKTSSWSLAKLNPMKKLTDQEYEEILEEKILQIDTSIALVDESIAALKAQKVATNEYNETPAS